MISLAALRHAMNAVIPHLPKAAGVVLTRSLPYLPLALELAKVLYKHREKIGTVVSDLATHTTNEITRVTRAAPYLHKEVGRKIKGCLQYLPLTLEIAKHSLENNKKVRSVTRQFPNEVKQKIERLLNSHQCPCRSTLFRNRQRRQC